MTDEPEDEAVSGREDVLNVESGGDGAAPAWDRIGATGATVVVAGARISRWCRPGAFVIERTS